MKSLFTPLRHLRAALVFMTRIPVRGIVDDADARGASAYFSFIGALVGALGALAWSLFGARSWVGACLAVATTALVTGALHEDGLADTADALGGASDREKLFLILKDPRVGSFGATALVLVLLLRVASLVELGSVAPAALVFAHVVSRFACTALLAALPYVSAEASSKSRSIIEARVPQVAIGAVPVLAFVAAHVAIDPRPLALVPVAVALASAIVASSVLAWRFHVRAGGITGDFLGASQQIVECAVYVSLSVQLA